MLMMYNKSKKWKPKKCRGQNRQRTRIEDEIKTYVEGGWTEKEVQHVGKGLCPAAD